MTPINPFDENSVMAEMGPIAPIILREAMESGFDAYKRSRSLDPVGFADYRPSTRANMLADRIYPYLIELVHVADPDGLHLRTRTTDNGRATELFIGSELYTKVKRIKDRSRRANAEDDVEVDGVIDMQIIEDGVPRNIPTGRVLRQLQPGAYIGRQLGLPGIPPVQIPDDGSERLCLVAGFDLDLTEDRMERYRIGLYDSKRAIWTQSLPELDLEVIASISTPLAEQVEVLRQARSA
jgi:hypothetical protein